MQYKHRSTSCVQVSTFMRVRKQLFTTFVNHVKNEVFAPALSLLVAGTYLYVANIGYLGPTWHGVQG